MKAASFVNVTVRLFKMPVGAWPKKKRLEQAGIYDLVGVADSLTGLSLRVFTQILGGSVDETETLLMQGRSA